MRKIILGSLKKNVALCKHIDQAYSCATQQLKIDSLSLQDDRLFFLQHQVDWGTNIKYDRNRHHLEFIISRQTPPSNKAIHATILKATIEQIIARTRQKHFQSQFLFDLYRLGVGTYYANMQQLTWQIQITPTLWDKVKKTSPSR